MRAIIWLTLPTVVFMTKFDSAPTSSEMVAKAQYREDVAEGTRLKCHTDQNLTRASANAPMAAVERLVPVRDAPSTQFLTPKFSLGQVACDTNSTGASCTQWKLSRSLVAGTKVEATTPTDWWLMGTKDYDCMNTKETEYNELWHTFLDGSANQAGIRVPQTTALARCCKNRTMVHYDAVTQTLTAVEDLSLDNLLDFSMYLKPTGQLYGYLLTNNVLYCYEFNGKQVKQKLWEIPVVLEKPSEYPFTVYFEGEDDIFPQTGNVNKLWHLKETEMDVDHLGRQWIEDFVASGKISKNWSDTNTKNVSRCVYCALVDSATGNVKLGPDATSNAACNGDTCESEMTDWVNGDGKKIFRPLGVEKSAGGFTFDTSPRLPTEQPGSGKGAMVHDCQEAVPATLAVNEKYITIQGNELLVYASVNQSQPNQTPTKVELRSTYRGFSAMIKLQKSFTDFNSHSEKRKDPAQWPLWAAPTTNICSVRAQRQYEFGVVNCGQITMGPNNPNRAFSMTSFGTVFEVNLETGGTTLLMETVCGPESTMAANKYGADALATPLGPPLVRPMCDGATGIAAAGFGTDTKIFVTVAPSGLAEAHQRAIVEFSAAEARSTPLLLNSSTPQQYSTFGLAMEFNVASLDQKHFKGNDMSQKNIAQLPKRFPGFQVRLSASHGKVIAGVTEAWNANDPDQGLRLHTAHAFCEKLDCAGLNEALKDLQWDAPLAQPGVFVTSEPIHLSISLCSGGSAKRDWKFQLSGTVSNISELDALVEERVSCAWPTSAPERKVCCTQKFVHGSVSSYSGESMRDMGLGKSLSGDGSTDNAGWVWPDLATVIPQLDGLESVVAGQPTGGPSKQEGQVPTVSSPQSDFFTDGVGEEVLFSANSVYSDAPNYSEQMPTDYVNGNGLSATKRGAELDIWLPDRSYTVDETMAKRCGSNTHGTKSRIVHVNARTRNTTTVLLSDVSKMFVDVASVALPVGAPTQVTLFVLYRPYQSQYTLAYSLAEVATKKPSGVFYWQGALPGGNHIRGSTNSFNFEVIRLVVSFNAAGNPVPESTTGTPILTIPDSNVLPSLAADKAHLYVLTATGLRKYSHDGGSALQTWGSSTNLEWPDFASGGLAALNANSWPEGGGYCCSAPLMTYKARMGGQVALHINAITGEAQEAYFTTVQGYLYRVAGTATNDAPQELMKNPLTVPTGLAVQAYTVPNSTKVQKRLYMTMSTITSQDCAKGMKARLQGTARVVRVNANALEQRLASEGRLTVEKTDGRLVIANSPTNEEWKSWHLEVIPEQGPSTAIARLAFADAKIFYMAAGYNTRYQLKSTGVTMSVHCDVMDLTAGAFKEWNIAEANYGKTQQTSPEVVQLKETSQFVPAMPWQFEASKKVVRWRTPQGNNTLVIKEVLCSRPQPPTTRPSREKCCTRNRVVSDVGNVPEPHVSAETCSMGLILKNL